LENDTCKHIVGLCSGDVFIQHGKDVVAAVASLSGQTVGEVIKQIDAAVAAERKANPNIDTADAITLAAEKHPDLAKARNRAMSQPIQRAITLTNR
jgi:hypothetical protein